MSNRPAARCPRCSATHPADAPRGVHEDARIGTTIAEKYTIVRLIGRGGMGSVFEGRHALLARRFAIKFLLPQFASHREVLRRFENEAKAAGRLEHPNLAAVTDFGRAPDGSPYLVMEFLDGEDCAGLLRRVGPLPAPRAANIVLQACRGLAVAHDAGIVHRDIKPENLFLTTAGDGADLVKILDFGIAKLLPADASVATNTGAAIGTGFYMSPEQARGAGSVDERTDVWSLGVVLYELLSGRKPFEGEQFLHVIHQILTADPPHLPTLRPGLPSGLVATVEKAMKKEPGERLPTVRALLESLTPFAATASPPRAHSAPRETVTRPSATDPGSSLSVRRGSRRLGGKSVARAAMVAAGLGLVALLGLRAVRNARTASQGAQSIVVSPVPVAAPLASGPSREGPRTEAAPVELAPNADATAVPAGAARVTGHKPRAAGSAPASLAAPVLGASAGQRPSSASRAVTIDTASPY